MTEGGAYDQVNPVEDREENREAYQDAAGREKDEPASLHPFNLFL